MADGEIIRNYSVFVKSRKVGEMTASEYTIMSNNEDQVGDGKWMGTSEGVKTTRLSATCIVPVRGLQNELENALLNDKYLQVAAGVVNGKIHKITMKVNQATYSTNSANGTLTGAFELSGGKPERIG